jgi:hypothetical protein
MSGGTGTNTLDGALGIDTAVFNFNFAQAGVTSAGTLSSIAGQNSLDTVKNTEVFAFADRSILQGDGNQAVDDLFYLSQYGDVYRNGNDAEQHFSDYGWKEGRNPNAFFDTKGYLAAYADVAAAGINPLEHYLTYGWKEGRDPSAQFDTKQYLAANGDVAAAGLNPLLHYLEYGAVEGRATFNDGTFA